MDFDVEIRFQARVGVRGRGRGPADPHLWIIPTGSRRLQQPVATKEKVNLLTVIFADDLIHRT
jgi:hypothetical protein